MPSRCTELFFMSSLFDSIVNIKALSVFTIRIFEICQTDFVINSYFICFSDKILNSDRRTSMFRRKKQSKSGSEKHTGRWISLKGPFKNYVDKMRGVGGSFLSTLKVQNVHAEVGRWSSKSKIMST